MDSNVHLNHFHFWKKKIKLKYKQIISWATYYQMESTRSNQIMKIIISYNQSWIRTRKTPTIEDYTHILWTYTKNMFFNICQTINGKSILHKIRLTPSQEQFQKWYTWFLLVQDILSRAGLPQLHIIRYSRLNTSDIFMGKWTHVKTQRKRGDWNTQKKQRNGGLNESRMTLINPTFEQIQIHETIINRTNRHRSNQLRDCKDGLETIRSNNYSIFVLWSR